MTPLSVIVITRNEERNIVACLESVKWADDIVIVDAESKDATVALARQFTPKVFIEPWKSFSDAKQFAISHSRHEWGLWLDADERVTPELAAEINRRWICDASRIFCRSASVFSRPMDQTFRMGPWKSPLVVQKYWVSFSPAAVHEGLIVQGDVGELRPRPASFHRSKFVSLFCEI